MNNFKVLMNGIVKENPTFVLLLGMCPTFGETIVLLPSMVWVWDWQPCLC